jgi:hypothetical protein
MISRLNNMDVDQVAGPDDIAPPIIERRTVVFFKGARKVFCSFILLSGSASVFPIY